MINKFFMVIIIGVLLGGCNQSSHPPQLKQKSYTLKSESLHKTLFFTGTIQPLKEKTLTFPMDAVIEKMNYHYGQMVKKNDVVVTLNSTELQRQYNEVLTEYLKAKDNFTVTSAKFIGTQNLWKAGLLSKNNYLSEKSSIDTARMTLMQATRKLTEMLEKMDNQDDLHLSKLSLAEFDKVKEALTGQHNFIHLKAPSQGLLLYPPKAGDEKNTRLSVGSSVKAGQVFALIGDLSGVSVEIDIPEIDIDKVHPGMKAHVTGIALGKEILQGELVTINAQASATNSNGLPSFTALVKVKKLTDEQRKLIKVGMSASIELLIEGENQLLIPIAAIQQVEGKSMVNIRVDNDKNKLQAITTGPAEVDKVVVISGLHEGQTVLYNE